MSINLLIKQDLCNIFRQSGFRVESAGQQDREKHAFPVLKAMLNTLLPPAKSPVPGETTEQCLRGT